MKLHLSRRRFLAGTAAASGALLLGRHGLAQEQAKVGFVYVGPIGDYGWTHGHELGREAVVEHFGDQVKTSYVENVAEGPDAERVIRQLATSGNGLIFTTSFGFMNPTVRVAKQFPKVKFEHATGYQTAPNLAVYNARFYEGRAVCGAIAGHVSKSGDGRLHRLVPDPRGGDGHQRLHARDAEGHAPTPRSRWSGSTPGTIPARRAMPPRR